jgi:epoxide hydrolase-like predicted phosphatase
MSELRGLLVDFGGVLTTNIWDSFRAFCDAESLDREKVKQLFREDPEALALLRRLEVGELDEDSFSVEFGPLLGISEDRYAGLVDRLFAGMDPEEAMFTALRRARGAGLKTGMISNSWGRGRYDRSTFDELFDGVVISGEVGLHKPQPEIFELGAERVGLTPERCVFVDDLRENCEGAEAVGMTAVLHRGAGETLARLEQLLEVELR